MRKVERASGPRLSRRTPTTEKRGGSSCRVSWAPSLRAILRMVDIVGAEARTFLDQCPAPESDGEILVLQANGGGAPMINEREHERRCRPRAATKPGVPRRHQRRQRRK